MSRWLDVWFMALVLAASLVTRPALAAPGLLSGSFSSIPAGSVVNLSAEGELDWVHWGLLNETSLDRKAGVNAQISDFTLLDAATGFSFAYWFGDNANGYAWSDGTPTPAEADTTTGVWAYGTPTIGSGFGLTAPADTATRTLKVYVGIFAGRGRFEASLSDNSARSFTDSTYSNSGNGPSGVYTLNYAASSPGQQLVIRWVLGSPMRPDANVTLQAATLTATNVDSLPIVAITTPAPGTSVRAQSDLTLTATASDIDSAIAKVEFFGDGIKLGETATSPYHAVWNSISPGQHVATALVTDAQGGQMTSAPVEFFAYVSGGRLDGAPAIPPALAASVNLTTEGTRDWAHWGLATNSLYDHKAGVIPQISSYTHLGTNPVVLYADNYSGFTWTDGTPTASAADAHKGVYSVGVGNGFELTVPADATARTLRVYVGAYAAHGEFTAWLGDFSAPAYVNGSVSNAFGNAYAVYALTFAAASAGQTLHARYRCVAAYDADFGNVTLQAATLDGAPVTNPTQTPVRLVNAHWNGAKFEFSFPTQNGGHYSVEHTDALSSGPWQSFTNVSGNGADAQVFDLGPFPGERFYRVVQ